MKNANFRLYWKRHHAATRAANRLAQKGDFEMAAAMRRAAAEWAAPFAHRLFVP